MELESQKIESSTVGVSRQGISLPYGKKGVAAYYLPVYFYQCTIPNIGPKIKRFPSTLLHDSRGNYTCLHHISLEERYQLEDV